jgi:hypothetical protein
MVRVGGHRHYDGAEPQQSEKSLVKKPQKQMPLPVAPLSDNAPIGMASILELAKAIEIRLVDQSGEPLAEVAQEATLVATKALAKLSSFVEIDDQVETSLQYTALAASMLQIALSSAEYHVRSMQIQQKKAELAQVQSKPATSSDQEALQNEVTRLALEIERLSAKNSKLLQGTALSTISLGLKTTQQVVSGAAGLVTHVPVVQALQTIGSVLGVVGSIVGVAISSKAIDDNRKLAFKIPAMKRNVEVQLEAAEKKTVSRSILKLRMKNLRFQEEENHVGIVKNSIGLAVSLLGTAVGAKVLLAVAGVAIGATIGASVAALGIAAAVLGCVGLAIGLGYVIYRRRHAIAHFFEKQSERNQEQIQTGLKAEELDTIRRSLTKFGSASEKDFKSMQKLYKKMALATEEELKPLLVTPNATGIQRWNAFIAYSTAIVVIN